MYCLLNLSYLSCPEKDDADDSDSYEHTMKSRYNQKLQQPRIPGKSCFKNSNYDYTALGVSSTTEDSDAKRSLVPKSNRMSLKFADDENQIIEAKIFSLDCMAIKQRTMSSDMELNATFGLRNKLIKSNPNIHEAPSENSKVEFRLENFILEEYDENLGVYRAKTELTEIKNRARSSSSIFSKLREKLEKENFLEDSD